MKICEPALAAALILAPATAPAPVPSSGQVTGPATEPVPGEFRRAAPGRAWDFPRDHRAHRDFRTEWWYVTGRLRDAADPARELGFQFTLFRIGLRPDPQPFDSAWSTAGLAMGHASITDIANGGHRFSEVLRREMPLLAGFGGPEESRLGWIAGPAGTDAPWTLTLEDGVFALSMADRARGFAFDLVARPTQRAVFHGENGFSAKSADGSSASHYYTLPRLALEGAVRIDDERLDVRGEGWMDREFSSNHLAERQVGWDWFGLHLDDGRALMLFRLRRADGSTDFASGTLVETDGSARPLGPGAFSVEPRRRWTSPETGARYPVDWDVAVPSAGLRFTVEAAVDTQENRSAARGGLYYWEGAVDLRAADGRALGRGYAELTGYGEDNRPPI